LRTLLALGTNAGLSDSQLLERFLARRDEAGEAAFATLVQRHGPMVLGICRRVLRDRHGAEDAFQATFLVLVHKARSIAQRERLASWLYGVALRCARKARSRIQRQRSREGPLVSSLDIAKPEAPPPDDELMAILDEELARLPERLRAAVVLCELEGLTRSAAALRLGIPEGTLSSRLASARRLLRERLTRRGVALSVPALAVALGRDAAAAGVPVGLVESTVPSAMRIAAGMRTSAAAPVSVATLTQGVLQAMLIKTIQGITLGIVALIAVVGVVWARAAAMADPPAAAAPSPPPQGDVEKELMRLQRQWAAAVVNQDRGALDQILAEDFVVTGPTGHVSSRQELLDMVAGGVSQVESLDVTDMFVHVYPNAAVILGRSIYKSRPGRSGLEGSTLWTNTYIRREGRWLCIAAHEAGWFPAPGAADRVPQFHLAPVDPRLPSAGLDP
jgi:RNA polymerase sigma factor (sigma-70 family)